MPSFSQLIAPIYSVLHKRRHAMTGNTLIGKARRVTLGSDISERTGGDPGGATGAMIITNHGDGN